MAASDFDRIADFRFVRLLGSGSFAHTYEALRDGKQFAVKVFYDLPATGEAQERFRREISTLRIEHPSLAEYVESGVALSGGRPAAYIAMRYIPGTSLRQYLADRGGKLPLTRALSIAQGIASGLQCLHEHGIVHRDLKPANVYLPTVGGVVILDFGLAGVQDLTTITARGAFIGTLAYCAPEQIRGEADIHSDLYALGAVLFQMITGQLVFQASNELELFDRIRHEDPEPPSALEPSVPAWLDRLILELLAKEPLQRPRAAQTVLDALKEPAQRAATAVRAQYDRNNTPLFVARVTSGSASRAVLDLGLRGHAPDAALGAVTQAAQLDELHRARGMTSAAIAVDTRILDTATSGFRSIAALRSREFLPAGAEPHTPASLRAPGETERVARGDIKEQIKEGADLLRAPAFTIETLDSGWLRRNPRLLESALAARDALAPTLPLFAQVPCTIDALTRRDDRLSIVNRFARGDPDGYWVGIAGAEVCDAEQLAAAFDFLLMLEQLGAPCVWTAPGTLAELAWSIGIAGVEIPLGRAGGFRIPAATRQIRRVDHASRFEFPSLMTSLSADLASQVLASEALPESACECPSCRNASDVPGRLAHADEHNLWAWIQLRDDLGQLDAGQRVERYRFRLKAAAKELAAARKAAPTLRSLRHIQLTEQTLAVVLEEGILDTPRRLRRAS
ncbi:MAG: serine/threonine-protein kinase [Solirubrobacteraceae bacterium]